MGLFDTPAVKELKKQAGFIGDLYGQVHLGHPYQISASDLDSLTRDEDQRVRLQEAFKAAAADIGDAKALKSALKAANYGADSYARLAKNQYGDVTPRAEQAIRDMLGR